MKEAGFYLNIKPEDYHAKDGCISSTALRSVAMATPAHADVAIEPEEKQTRLGRARHSYLFGHELDEVGIATGYNDWRTKDSKEAREFIIDQGKTPLLDKEASDILEWRDTIWTQLSAITCIDMQKLFFEREKEISFYWKEGRFTCKGRLDVQPWTDNPVTILDVKTTDVASPRAWINGTIRAYGHVQAAHYATGVATLLDMPPSLVRWIWVVCENKPPYGVYLVEADGQMMESGFAARRRAMEALAEERGTLVYPDEIIRGSLPSYLVELEESK